MAGFGEEAVVFRSSFFCSGLASVGSEGNRIRSDDGEHLGDEHPVCVG